MNKLHTLLEVPPINIQEQFEKAFKKVFGIPAEIQEYDLEKMIFQAHEETFSIDWEGALLWELNKKWERIDNIDQARDLWKKKKK
jgi:hypothetical protein